MNLTYEQFMNIVPKETAEFVDELLPYLGYYVKGERNIKFNGVPKDAYSYYEKVALLALHCLSLNEKYSIFLGQYGFNSDKLSRRVMDYVLKQGIYNEYGSIFNIYKDESLYLGLTPLEIVSDAFGRYKNTGNLAIFNSVFPKLTNLSAFEIELRYMIECEKSELEHKIEKDLYKQLSISVILYLETASQIRTILNEKLNNKKSELDVDKESDIIPLSLLLSLYYYNGAKEQTSEQSLIQNFLERKGITKSEIEQILGIKIDEKILNKTNKNIYSLKLEYERYFKEGKNKDISPSEITISKILANAFDRNFTNSTLIDKLINKQNSSLENIEISEEAILQYKEEIEKQQELEEIKAFYVGLEKEPKEFIEFTSKIYVLILQKMKDKKHNEKYLCNEDDADTLALFLASSYYDLDVAEFFNDYGVTVEKIFNLLKLSITIEEIEQIEVDRKILVKRYNRFVHEGINGGIEANNITVQNISYNLCNREFNKTMILENIFEDIRENFDLESDFFNQLELHLKNKEITRKRELTQQLFYDMPIESIEYLEIVSKIHQTIMPQLPEYSEKDIISIAMLLGFVKNENKKNEFLIKKGLNHTLICQKLNISISDYEKRNIDIDLLAQKYGPYIFEGENTGVERKDLNVYNIAKNIFSKKINNSVMLSKFLSKFSLSYDFFEKFDENYLLYLKREEENLYVEKVHKLLFEFNDATRCYLENVIKIHKRISVLLQKNEILQKKIHNENDMIEISIVLGLFTEVNDSRHFFKKNGLTLENILNELELDDSIVKDLDAEWLDCRIAVEKYESFIKAIWHKNCAIISDIAKKIFDPEFAKNTSILKELTEALGANYNILKEEVETEKDYEVELTMDDRIQLLHNSKVDSLNLNEIKSVLNFGNSLYDHSKYIHDELSKLITEDTHDESIETINEIITRVYKKNDTKSQKKGFFARIFSVSKEDENVKLEINHSAVKDLKEEIDYNLEILSGELVAYDQIRRYIEAYHKKNYDHLVIASSELKKIEEKMASLDSNNDEEYAEFLQTSSQLQIMQNKVNRFSTSNQLMKQELFKVNQAIVNHFITINALEMARDDLFPLIGSELMLAKGMQSESNALGLSQNVIGLFQAILTRNIGGTIENMERIKQANLPDNVYEMLSKDLETYLNSIKQAEILTGRNEDMELSELDLSKPTITLDDNRKENDSYKKILTKKF